MDRMKRLLCKLTDYRSIAIIGMAKNVGKTTLLNFLLNKARGTCTLGLTSIGRDGEDTDHVTGTEKPRIWVYRGTIIATARRCLSISDITLEIMATTGMMTPMGEIIIIKALSDGYIELAGPSINQHLHQVCDRLLALGCTMVLCDGAISRKTSASPAITEAAILSTGASVHEDMIKVIEDTVHAARMLSIQVTEDDKLIEIAYQYEDTKVIIIDQDYHVKPMALATALASMDMILQQLNECSRYLLIRGVVTDDMLNRMMTGTKKAMTVVVEDGTKLMLSHDMYERFIKSGGKIEVLHTINLIGISVNPVSPYGYTFDPKVFLDELTKRISIPVFNVYDDYLPSKGWL